MYDHRTQEQTDTALSLRESRKAKTPATWIRSDGNAVDVARYVCRPGESINDLAGKLCYRLLSRSEERRATDYVIAVIEDGCHRGACVLETSR